MSKKFTNANIAQRLAEKQKELQLQRDKTQLSAQSKQQQQVTPVNTRFAVLKVNKPKKEAVKTESSTPSLATANVWQTEKESEPTTTPAKRAGVSGEPSWGDESEEMDFSEPLPGMHRNSEQTKATSSTPISEPEHAIKAEPVNSTPAPEPVEAISQPITNTDTPKNVPEALTEISSNSQDSFQPQPYFSPHNAPVLVPVFVPPRKEEFPPFEQEGDETSSTSSFSTDIDRALEQNESPQRHAKPAGIDNPRPSNTDTKSTVFHSVHPSPPFKVLLRRAQPPPPDPTPLPLPLPTPVVSTEVSSPVKIAARRPHNIHDPSIQPVAPPRNLGQNMETPQGPKNPTKEGNNRRKGRGRGSKEELKQSERANPVQNPQSQRHDYGQGSSSEDEQPNKTSNRRRNKGRQNENPNGRNKATPDHWQHDDRTPQKFEDDNRRSVGPEIPTRGKKPKERPTPVDWEGFRTGSGWNQEQIPRQEQGQRQDIRQEQGNRQDQYQRQDPRHERQDYVRQEQNYRQDQRTNPRHDRQDNYKPEQIHRQDQARHQEHQNQRKSNQQENQKENQNRQNPEKQEQNPPRNNTSHPKGDNKPNRDRRKDTSRYAEESHGHQRYDRYYENEPADSNPRGKWVQKSKT